MTTNQPSVHLRALIKATGGRPFFIRSTRLTPDAAARYLMQSKRPAAKAALGN